MILLQTECQNSDELLVSSEAGVDGFKGPDKEAIDPLPLETYQPRSSPQLLSLPTEILCNILDAIPLTRTLAVCCRICKTLLPLVLSRLYRTLVLRSSTRGSALSPDAPTILNPQSSQILNTLSSSPYGISHYPTKLDFDLTSAFLAAQIGETLATVLKQCRNVVELKLGKGDRGHGMSFVSLSEMLLRMERDNAVQGLRLKVLRIEECVGNGTTLANVLVKLPHLVDLRIGQFLLEPSDFDDVSPPPLPTFRLRTFVAKYRLTPFAFDFCTSSSSDTLRSIDVPINERTHLDLSKCSALTEVTLSLSLISSITTSITQTSYFSNKRSNNLVSSSPPASVVPLLAKLATNFRSTLESIPYLTHLSIKGTWDVGDPEPLDIVRHASLLSHLSCSTIETLSIKTELNSIALVEWLDGMETAGGGRGKLRKLELWQKSTFSAPKREFQRKVREKVQDKANERGIKCEWFKYEKW
ncbi:uncharacterized protein JCM6883_003208 [Sporobolomyces salmoneus]|uniref:uncharacterized protein n=1 Tax=Sporobolomyces salmoneus TaxID=183962 RepID=UPI0031745CFC